MEIKIENYGDMLAQVTGKKLISYVGFGRHQGEWIATLEDGDNIELWKGYYGSCSACDWIVSKINYQEETISLEDAKEFFKEDRPFAVIPKETLSRVDLETFTEMLPANIRANIYEFDPKELYDDIKKHLIYKNMEPEKVKTSNPDPDWGKDTDLDAIEKLEIPNKKDVWEDFNKEFMQIGNYGDDGGYMLNRLKNYILTHFIPKAELIEKIEKLVTKSND